MSPVDQFVIALDGNKTIYHPGDPVKGSVLLRLSGPFSMTRIVVGFYGQGYVTYKSGKTRYHYTQPYFAYQCVAYDANNEAPHQRYGGNFFPGEYWFPFSFVLPPCDLPTSIHDNRDSVRYWLEATIERRMWFNKKTVVAIFVVDSININTPQLQQSQSKQDEQCICCCCVKGGSVNVTGKINKGGFYPGEPIQAKFYVENQSTRDVTYTEMKLVQKLKKRYGESSGDYNTYRTTITSITGRAVPKRQEADIEGLTLTIPTSLAPSTAMEDSIISVSYEVELIAHVKGACVCSSSIDLPVTIGFVQNTQGNDWTRMVLQVIEQLINESAHEAQEGQVNQGGDDGRYDDRAMLMA